VGLETHRRRVSAQKRSSILEAARKNFLTNGYSGAGMAEIARDADVSTATLYKHFSSKEALFTAVVKESAQGAGDYSGIHDPKDSAREALHKLCRAYLAQQFEEDGNALMRIVIAEVPGAPGLANEMYEILSNRRNASLRAQIDTLIEQGKLRPHDSAFSVRICTGMLKEVFVWSALFDAGVTLPPDTDEKIHAIIDAWLKLYGPSTAA
jgi:TetR/AcrR family transcriptional regulator, regulator of autoinduction and epiphytic fitness